MADDVSGGKDTKVIYKSAVTGKMVSKEYYEKHPRTTSAMTVPENTNPADYEGEGDPTLVEDEEESTEEEDLPEESEAEVPESDNGDEELEPEESGPESEE